MTMVQHRLSCETNVTWHNLTLFFAQNCSTATNTTVDEKHIYSFLPKNSRLTYFQKEKHGIFISFYAMPLEKKLHGEVEKFTA